MASHHSGARFLDIATKICYLRCQLLCLGLIASGLSNGQCELKLLQLMTSFKKLLRRACR